MKMSRCAVPIAVVTLFVLARPAWAQNWTPLRFHGGDARLFTLDGDWAPNLWKGECGGTVVIGVSSTGFGSCGLFECSDEWTDDILCATPPTTVVQTTVLDGPGNGDSYVLDFFGRDDRRDTTWGDWAPNLFKGECAATDAITGLAQIPYENQIGPQTGMAICSPLANNVGAQNCEKMDFSAQDAREPGSVPSVDWDKNFYKGQCAPGRYVKGVAVRADVDCGNAGCPGQRAREILCCSPTLVCAQLGGICSTNSDCCAGLPCTAGTCGGTAPR
jgi:hypothetical protein